MQMFVSVLTWRYAKTLYWSDCLTVFKWVERYFKNESYIREVKGHPGPETPSFDRRLKVFNTVLLCCCTSGLHILLHPNTFPNQFAVKMKAVSGYVLFLNLGPNVFNILRWISYVPDRLRVDMGMSKKTQKHRLFSATVTVTYLWRTCLSEIQIQMILDVCETVTGCASHVSIRKTNWKWLLEGSVIYFYLLLWLATILPHTISVNI